MPAAAQLITFVDDDGAQCSGAVRTIQEAVALAPAGATILVCPGTYQKTVLINGHAKDAIKLIAVGHAGQVVLQGDHTEVNGFHLEDVDGVLLSGFTVRDFGMGPTVTLANGMVSAGMGNGILLVNANYNTIENNRIFRTDMMGIYLVNSANNTVRYNVTFDNDTGGSACGIMLAGRMAGRNIIFQNVAYGNGLAGLMIADSGTGNLVVDNDFRGNGRWGIENRNTDDTWIEGNRVSYSSGHVGELAKAPMPAFCPAQPCGLGLHIRGSNNVTVFDNHIRNNPNLDVLWDGNGQIRFEANFCETSNREGFCRRQ
ncbi:MAG: right-handed parallel beta-helix repeat-containing protein [Bryobacteraceae bacterium]